MYEVFNFQMSQPLVFAACNERMIPFNCSITDCIPWFTDQYAINHQARSHIIIVKSMTYQKAPVQQEICSYRPHIQTKCRRCIFHASQSSMGNPSLFRTLHWPRGMLRRTVHGRRSPSLRYCHFQPHKLFSRLKLTHEGSQLILLTSFKKKTACTS